MPAPALPPLISVRGWSAEDDPRYPAFVEHLRATGVEVTDLWVPPDPFNSMAEWAAAVRVELDRRDDSSHLLGYCLGGHILWELISHLEAAARPPAYVGLIDCWRRPAAQWVDRGFYGRYGVGWSIRVRHQLGRLAPPRAEAPSTLLRSWSVRAGRTTARTLRGRSHVRQRPDIRNWHGQHLAYDWTFPVLRTRIHLYNADLSVADQDDDPSLGLAPYLLGGCSVEVLPATDHKTCLAGPSADLLTAAIARDRVPIT